MSRFVKWIVMCMAPTLCAHAQSLDPSFGNSGRFTLELAGASSNASRMIRDAGGNSFIAGITPGMGSSIETPHSNGGGYRYVPTDATRDMLIAKITPGGELDRSFSGDGIATIDFNGRDDRAMTLVQQTDGKLLVLGTTEVLAGQFDLAIARLRADGTLDPTFNGTGKVTLDLGGTQDVAADVKLLPNGTLLVVSNSGTLATETTPPGFVRPVVTRLRANGSLDATFDGDGLAMPVLPGSTHVQSLLLAQDGKIVLAGLSADAVVAVLIRLNATGALDPTFGNAGVRTFDIQPQGWPAQPFGVLPSSEGSFMVAGLAIRTGSSTPFGTFISRFDGSGEPDAAFGAGGTAMHFIPRDFNYAYSMALEPNGKILLAGLASRGLQSGPTDPYVARLLPDGALDETFGEHGVMLLEPGDASLTSVMQSLTRAANGRLQLSGYQGEHTNVAGLLGGDMVPQTERAFVIQLNSTPTFSFSASTASVNESQGSVELTVSRTGTTTGTVSVQYSTVAIGSSQSPGFTPTSGTLSWSPSDPQTKTITVGIVSDSIDQPNREFRVVLSEPSEGATAGVESVAVSIVDDDEPALGGSGGGGSLDFGGLSLLLALLLRSRRNLARLDPAGTSSRN